MKNIMTICAVCMAFSAQVFASNLETVEGKVSFEKGQYVLTSEQNTLTLEGLSLTQLRQYEGRTVKVAGEIESGDLEIYKVFVKTENGYESSYDWDVVNQELYAD